jgi:hypothetical protein
MECRPRMHKVSGGGQRLPMRAVIVKNGSHAQGEHGRNRTRQLANEFGYRAGYNERFMV